MSGHARSPRFRARRPVRWFLCFSRPRAATRRTMRAGSLASARRASRSVERVERVRAERRVGAGRSTSSRARAARRGRARALSLDESDGEDVGRSRVDAVVGGAVTYVESDEAEPPTAPRAATAFPLACPVTLRALRSDGTEPSSGLRYEEVDGRWDLTVGAAVNARAEGGKPAATLVDLAREALPRELRGLLPTSGYFGTATFETPQVAFAYERGWRDSFARAGFPGPDEETRLAMDALGAAARGGIIVDASCGSGLFTRRFLKTKAYKGVVALDYSDAMLRQAKQYMEDEKLLGNADVCFVRADIARLPFPESSLDGVHAGAAIHCWPDAKTAMAEISRVLKPGATFCGTTFMNPQVPFFDENTQEIFDNAVRQISGTANASRGFRWWSKKELKDLCSECGLVDFKCEVRQQFIFFSAKKRTEA